MAALSQRHTAAKAAHFHDDDEQQLAKATPAGNRFSIALYHLFIIFIILIGHRKMRQFQQHQFHHQLTSFPDTGPPHRDDSAQQQQQQLELDSAPRRELLAEG